MEAATTVILQFVISRTPNREGVVFEVESVRDGFKFQVLLETVKKKLFAGISSISGRVLTFEHPSMPLKVLVPAANPNLQFWSLDGTEKGHSSNRGMIIGKTTVEDESKTIIGWIKWGFKKHRIFLANGGEVGFVIRVPAGNFPRFITPSKAYLLERLEFFGETGVEYDLRLLYAFIAMRVHMEHSRSGGDL